MMRKLTIVNKFFVVSLLFSFLIISKMTAQKTITYPEIGAIGGSTSGGLGTNTLYAINENLYTDADLAAGGKAISITRLTLETNGGFPSTPVGNNVFTKVKIRIKEVPAATTTLAATAWDTTSYPVKVFDGTITVGANVVRGQIPINFSTPFIKSAGTNIVVLVERLDNVSHVTGSWIVVGNAANAIRARRYNSNTAPVHGTTVIPTGFSGRSITGFTYSFAEPNADLDHVYTLGSMPIPYATPHIVQASISNNSAVTAYNIPAKLTITGSNAIVDSMVIDSILPGRRIISFPAFTPTNYGMNTLNVTIGPPTGGFNVKSSFSMDQQITTNTYSMAYGFNGAAPVADGGVGFNGATGDFIAKFYSDSPSNVTQAVVRFGTVTQGQPFKIGIWGDNGSGTPGTLLWESPQQTSATGNFTVPVVPKVAVNGNFFVGVRQLGLTNVAFAYQSEAPPRQGSYFFTSPTGNTAWTDFATSNSPFRFFAEAKLELANDVGAAQVTFPASGITYSACDTVAPQALVANYGVFDQFAVPVNFEIKDQSNNVLYSETVLLDTLLNGQSKVVTFPKSFLPSATPGITTTYNSVCRTILAGDQDTANDQVNATFSFGQFEYGTDNAINGVSKYQYSNSTLCSSTAPNPPTYSWIDPVAAGHTSMTIPANADDVFFDPITLPFPFLLYGVGYPKAWVSSNGFITFIDPLVQAVGGANNDGTALTLPAVGGFNAYIAGCLTDLDLTQSKFPDAKIYHGLNPLNQDEYVITFWHVHKFKPTAPAIPEYVTFQIILKNDRRASFKVQYNEAETANPIPTIITNQCSAGAEDATGTQGFTYRLNGGRGRMFSSPLAWQAELIQEDTIKLQARVFFNHTDPVAASMSTAMPTLTNFPMSDPYSALPLNASFIHTQNGATMSTTPAFLAAMTGNDAIVDWVFLELRTPTVGGPAVTAHTQAALVQADGDIIDAETGLPQVRFPMAKFGNHHVVVRHRNHLGIATLDALPITFNTPMLDFKANTVAMYGSVNPLISLTPTVWVTSGGDANYDGSIDAFDTIIWEAENGLFDDYTLNSDYNMDGSSDALDSILWELNNGKFEELP